MICCPSCFAISCTINAVLYCRGSAGHKLAVQWLAVAEMPSAAARALALAGLHWNVPLEPRDALFSHLGRRLLHLRLWHVHRQRTRLIWELGCGLTAAEVRKQQYQAQHSGAPERGYTKH
jgi:hypothetical protein